MSETIELEPLGNISHVYMVGDSHCLKFADLTYRPVGTPYVFACQTEFIPSLFHNSLHLLKEGLKAAGFFDVNDEPCWLTIVPIDAFVKGRPVLSPAMVIFLGEADLQVIISQISGFDFELPDDPGYGIDFDSDPIDYDSVWQEVKNRFDPLVEAVESLRHYFPRLMWHGLPPRCRDDAKATRWSGSRSAARMRAKVTLMANRLLKSACARSGIPFIDVWDELSLDGYLRPDMDLDGLHLARPAADVSMRAVVSNLFDRTGPTAHPVRYARAKALSPAYAGPGLALQPSWTESGYVMTSVDVDAITQASSQLDFKKASQNIRACPEWVGFPRAGRPDISIAEPTTDVLRAAAVLLEQPDAKAALQVNDDKDFTVISFRIVESPAFCSTTAAVLPSPVGCRRAVLFLEGKGEFILELISGGIAETVQAKPGALIVCDNTRTWCHVASGDNTTRFAEIALMPRYPTHPFRVLAAGLSEWPCDPFYYPVGNMIAFPPFDGDLVYEQA